MNLNEGKDIGLGGGKGTGKGEEGERGREYNTEVNGIRKTEDCFGSEKNSVESEDFRRESELEIAGDVYAVGVKSKAAKGSRKMTWNSSLIFENLTWLTSIEAAQYLRLPSVGALRVLVCKRRVPFHKLGRSLRFKKRDLDRLLETSRNGAV